MCTCVCDLLQRKQLAAEVVLRIVKPRLRVVVVHHHMIHMAATAGEDAAVLQHHQRLGPTKSCCQRPRADVTKSRSTWRQLTAASRACSWASCGRRNMTAGPIGRGVNRSLPLLVTVSRAGRAPMAKISYPCGHASWPRRTARSSAPLVYEPLPS